jgi:hypothetical protein
MARKIKRKKANTIAKLLMGAEEDFNNSEY